VAHPVYQPSCYVAHPVYQLPCCCVVHCTVKHCCKLVWHSVVVETFTHPLAVLESIVGLFSWTFKAFLFGEVKFFPGFYLFWMYFRHWASASCVSHVLFINLKISFLYFVSFFVALSSILSTSICFPLSTLWYFIHCLNESLFFLSYDVFVLPKCLPCLSSVQHRL